ncbi:MAG TPA: TonB-dependent receptor [Gammaproteobacteria bacterium]|jgi:iron complex outermembrane receptor protein
MSQWVINFVRRFRIVQIAFSCAGIALVAPALAQDSGLEEIVVSARYKEEKLQETPLAITAFSGANLEAKNLTNLTEVDSFSPNTVIQPLGAGWGSTAAAYIRGIGLGDNSLSFEPGVPIYIDDVYHGRPQGALFDLLDLERVEILRGPQGTLFGKNSVGGTVRMVSKKPEGDNSGFVEATYGKYDRIDVRGAFDVSIIPDTLFARVSASTKNRDGYFKILDFECVNGAGSLGAGGTSPPLGSVLGPTDVRAEDEDCEVDRLGDEKVASGRLALRWVASEDVDVNLVFDYTKEDNKGPADKYTVIDPTFGFGLTDLWNNIVAVPRYGVPYDARFITDSPYTGYHRYGPDDITGRDVQNVRELDHWGVAGTIEWQVTDDIHVKSITSYRDFVNTFGRDSDGSPLPEDITWDTSKHDQFTQEVQLTGLAFDDRLDWALGAFYYDADDSNQGWNALYPLFFVAQNHKDVQEITSWAVFAHATYAVTDQLNLTAGIRYTDDEKTDDIFRQDQLTLAVLVDHGIVEVNATEWSPKVGLDYRWTEDIMTYAQWATGFRGGGFGPRPSDLAQVEAFDIEEAKTWEVGLKADWFEDRLRTNASWFFTKYTGQQSPAQDFDSHPDPADPLFGQSHLWFRTVNADKTEIWGFEMEVQAQPIDGLTIEGMAGYLNYDRVDPGVSDLCREDINGDKCPGLRSPKWSSALGATYTWGLGSAGTLSIRGDAVYKSRIWYSADDPAANAPATGYQGGHTLLDARMTWVSPDEAWELALFGTNLTDKVYFDGKLSLVTLLQRQQGNVAPPRQWGVTVKRTF